MRLQVSEQRSTVGAPVQAGHTVQCLSSRQCMGLPVIDHLHTMLCSPQRDISVRQIARLLAAYSARLSQGGERQTRIADPECRVTPAMDQLVDLGEELDLPDPPASPLQIIAGAEDLALRVMITDPTGNFDDLTDRPEIQAASPDEGADRIEEALAERQIAGRSPRADESRPLPRQRLRLIISDCRLHR